MFIFIPVGLVTALKAVAAAVAGVGVFLAGKEVYEAGYRKCQADLAAENLKARMDDAGH